MGTARLTFGSGMVVVPADSPYDRQQFIDQVLSCVRQWGRAEVHLNHTTWLIERPTATLSCTYCRARIETAACRHREQRAHGLACISCALMRPVLTAAMLRRLPPNTVLRDVQVHAAHGGEWVMWMRWPQATPAEILDDMRLQRRFAPILRFRCAEISSTGRAAPLAKGLPLRSQRVANAGRRA